ncbi:MAG: hypothetical protein ABI026_09075 [Gemmatimonadaceae bacterium]
MKKQLSSLIAGAVVVIPAIVLMACASAGSGRSEGPTNPVDVVVKNNLLMPTDITIYAISVDGSRTLLGSVHPLDSATFSFKPSAFSQQYRLLAIRSGRRSIRSEVFSVTSTNTGRITWTMIPNIIGFQGATPDTTAASDTSSLSAAPPRTEAAAAVALSR